MLNSLSSRFACRSGAGEPTNAGRHTDSTMQCFVLHSLFKFGCATTRGRRQFDSIIKFSNDKFSASKWASIHKTAHTTQFSFDSTCKKKKYRKTVYIYIYHRKKIPIWFSLHENDNNFIRLLIDVVVDATTSTNADSSFLWLRLEKTYFNSFISSLTHSTFRFTLRNFPALRCKQQQISTSLSSSE